MLLFYIIRILEYYQVLLFATGPHFLSHYLDRVSQVFPMPTNLYYKYIFGNKNTNHKYLYNIQYIPVQTNYMCIKRHIKLVWGVNQCAIKERISSNLLGLSGHVKTTIIILLCVSSTFSLGTSIKMLSYQLSPFWPPTSPFVSPACPFLETVQKWISSPTKDLITFTGQTRLHSKVSQLSSPCLSVV